MKLSLALVTATLTSLNPSFASASTATPETEAISIATPPTPRFSRSLALTVDPISAMRDSRYGVKAELMLLPHHAAVVRPFGYLTNLFHGSGQMPSTAAYGADVGYRYYLDKTGLSGLFVGPSVSYMRLQSEGASVAGASPAVEVQELGLAIDAGWKQVLSNGFSYGGGVGIAARARRTDYFGGLAGMSGDQTTLAPRVLCELGYVFDLH